MPEPRRYAEGTSVSVDRSKAEIDHLLRAHGATACATMWAKDRFVLAFEMRARQVRLDVPAPDPKRFPGDKWDREQRRRWRVLLLILKAKLETVRDGDADFEAEFLAYLVLPGGATIGERVLPDLERAIAGHGLPALLPARGGT